MSSGKRRKKPTLPPTLRAADDRDVVGVFVLGESATRNHWGLYGYPRDTTPQLAAIHGELTVFDDLVTPDPITGVAPQEDFLDDAFAPRRPRLIQSGLPYPERTRQPDEQAKKRN